MSKYAPRYYSYNNSINVSDLLTYFSTMKIKSNDNIFVIPTIGIIANNINTKDIIGCSFIPIYLVFTTTPKFIDYLDTLINNFKEEAQIDENTANKFLSAFTEITEDEYYKID